MINHLLDISTSSTCLHLAEFKSFPTKFSQQKLAPSYKISYPCNVGTWENNYSNKNDQHMLIILYIVCKNITTKYIQVMVGIREYLLHKLFKRSTNQKKIEQIKQVMRDIQTMRTTEVENWKTLTLRMVIWNSISAFNTFYLILNISVNYTI